MRVGETGVLRGLSFDQLRSEIHFTIECESTTVALMFPLRATSGPRNGHMRTYFELGAYAPLPGEVPVQQPADAHIMKVPPPKMALDHSSPSDDIELMAGPDRREDMEQALRQEIQHIGAASSIAHAYARRMRAFRRAGNEPRAAAAFALATEWMATYAGWATSGGEGAALSLERDRFHAALVKEFGYDPTAT